MDIVEFAKRLKVERTTKMLTQEQLAKEIGVTTSAISYYENGERAPSINVVVDLAKALDVSINYLIGEEKQQNNIEITNHESLDVMQIISNLKNLSDEELKELFNEANVLINYIRNKYNI